MASQSSRLSSDVLTSTESVADIVARVRAERAEQEQVASVSIKREYCKLIGQEASPSEVLTGMRIFVARLLETGIMTERDRNFLAEKAEKEVRETRKRQAEGE
jgi:hypothetical protein